MSVTGVQIKHPLKIHSALFLLPAALLRAAGRPLPGCFAGSAAQRPLPVRGERLGGVHGGRRRRRPVPVFPSSAPHHRWAQLLAVRRQPTPVTPVTPDRRARQWSRWDANTKIVALKDNQSKAPGCLSSSSQWLLITAVGFKDFLFFDTNHIAGIESVVKMNFTGRKWSLTGLAHLNSKYVARDVKSLLWFSRHHTENQTRIRRRKNKRQKTVKQHLTTKSALSRLL